MKEFDQSMPKENVFDRQIIVMKFGGSSLADAGRISHAAGIVSAYVKEAPVVVVVSAIQGVTDKLYSLYDAISSNRHVLAENILQGLENQHREVAQSLSGQASLPFAEGPISAFRNDISRYIDQGLSHPSDKDRIVSFGERLTPFIFKGALKQHGVDAGVMDSGNAIVTDGRYGGAAVNLNLSRPRVRNNIYPLIKYKRVPIMGGFYGSSEEGNITILGRGGSDYTASALANTLNAQKLILWKEVDGVYSHDPKLSPHARLYRNLTYNQALEMAQQGAKILHPEAMKPVAELKIPVFVKNTLRPEFPGTRIGGMT